MNKNIIIYKSLKELIDSKVDDTLLSNSYVVYCRVSSEQQIDGTSLDVQQKRGINHFNREQYPFENIIVLREEGKSGTDKLNGSIKMRELFDFVIQKIKQKIITELWVNEISRFSRNDDIGGSILLMLYKTKVNIYVSGQKWDVSDLKQNKILGMMIGFKEIDNYDRWNSSQRGKIEKGKYYHS